MVTLTDLEKRMRKDLINFVKLGDYDRSFVRYKPLAEKFGLPFDNSNERNDLFWRLGNISEYEHENNRPLLSVVVVNDEFQPGKGFFTLARRLGKQTPDKDDDTFARDERKLVFDFWKNNDDSDA